MSKISYKNMVEGKTMRNIRFEGVNPIRPRSITIVSILKDKDNQWYNDEEAILIIFKTFTKRYGWFYIIKPYWELATWNKWKLQTSSNKKSPS